MRKRVESGDGSYGNASVKRRVAAAATKLTSNQELDEEFVLTLPPEEGAPPANRVLPAPRLQHCTECSKSAPPLQTFLAAMARLAHTCNYACSQAALFRFILHMCSDCSAVSRSRAAVLRKRPEDTANGCNQPCKRHGRTQNTRTRCCYCTLRAGRQRHHRYKDTSGAECTTCNCNFNKQQQHWRNIC